MRCRRLRPNKRRGAVIVLAAIFMVVMLGMIAFAIDCGMIVLVRSQLQNAADAGAMAGADALGNGSSAAQAAAQTFAQSNTVAGTSVSVVPAQDIELGTWDKVALTFTPLSGAAQSNANAVRVTCRVSQARGNALNFFFARIFNQTTADVSAQSVATGAPVKCGPFIGVQSVDMSGSAYTDSFDSSMGPYSGGSAGNQGHVCSNGPISMSGSSEVNGDAHPGKGYTLKTSGSASVSGSQTPLTTALNEHAVDPGDAATVNNNKTIPLTAKGKNPLDSHGNFSLSGSDTVTLQPGTYYFAKFQLSGSSSVSLTGKTIFYCTDQVDLSGGTFFNPSQQAADCQIYGMGNKVSLSGSSDFYGVVYAPSADIDRSGSSDFYGMMVGATLKLSGSGGLHYDESLGTLSGIQASAQIVQ
jgi:Flp pilus assembly protein TadG